VGLSWLAACFLPPLDTEASHEGDEEEAADPGAEMQMLPGAVHPGAAQRLSPGVLHQADLPEGQPQPKPASP